MLKLNAAASSLIHQGHPTPSWTGEKVDTLRESSQLTGRISLLHLQVIEAC